MDIKLLTEHHLEFLSLKGGCTGLSESIYVKMPIVGNHVAAHICNPDDNFFNYRVVTVYCQINALPYVILISREAYSKLSSESLLFSAMIFLYYL